MSVSRARWQAASSFAEPSQSPGFSFWRDFMLWQRGLNAVLRPLGLTQPQFAVLAVCGWLTRDGAGVSQQKVVDFLEMDRAHISQIATRLERDGLIRRQALAADLRSKTVSLTDVGQALLFRALPLVESFDRRFFAQR